MPCERPASPPQLLRCGPDDAGSALVSATVGLRRPPSGSGVLAREEPREEPREAPPPAAASSLGDPEGEGARLETGEEARRIIARRSACDASSSRERSPGFLRASACRSCRYLMSFGPLTGKAKWHIAASRSESVFSNLRTCTCARAGAY